MSQKSGWRILAEEAKRAGTERLARSLPGGYLGGLVRDSFRRTIHWCPPLRARRPRENPWPCHPMAGPS